MSEIDEIELILAAKPGETLIVKASRIARPEQVEEISRLMQEKVSDGVRVLVLGGEIDMVSIVANADAERIAEAVRKATENPGKTFEVDQ